MAMPPSNQDKECKLGIHASTTHTYQSRQTITTPHPTDMNHRRPGSPVDNDEELELVLRESAAQAEEDEKAALRRLLEQSRAEAERVAAVDEAAELAAALARSQLDAVNEEEAQVQQLLEQSRAEFFSALKAKGAVADDDEATMDAVKKRSAEDWHKCTWDQQPPVEGNWSERMGLTHEERFQTTTSYTHCSTAKGSDVAAMGFGSGVGMGCGVHPLPPYAVGGPGQYSRWHSDGGGAGGWPSFTSRGPHCPVPGALPSLPARGAASVPIPWMQAPQPSHAQTTAPLSTPTGPSSTPTAHRPTGAAAPSVAEALHSPAVTVRSLGKQISRPARSTPQSPGPTSQASHPVTPIESPRQVPALAVAAEDDKVREGPEDPTETTRDRVEQKSVGDEPAAAMESQVRSKKENFEELEQLVNKEKEDLDTGGDVEGDAAGVKEEVCDADGDEDKHELEDPELVKAKRLAFLDGLSR
ncbi:uncharacterized protein EI97DRAFT_89399 [Westerdykella ornata]|uniref:Uncharacterized protein n=1 Tax=Westerdykella ornata TaxID=318751 RepID=A0A6A6JER4_WESOR|nr:uncharacterized protein EI97DRAFT_89399 [Westerdykella ornata]KAF2274797.1 hypothetical protein EI97DRAFT_89399 [Westerdykella ornata]